MEIITFNKTQLNEAILANTLWSKDDVVPMSRNKALLFLNNPHSKDEDVLLLLAKENGKTIGYRAMWPDKIISDGKPFDVAWGSCYWVDPQYRGKGVGAALLNKSFELYNKKIGSLSQSEMASRVYEKADKYFKYAETEGYQFIVRSNFTYWVKKKFSRLQAFLIVPFIILDGILNLFFRIKQLIWLKTNRTNELNLEYVNEIYDNELIEFINKRNVNDITPKNQKELNIIIKHPTSLTTPLPDSINSRYFFNTPQKRFFYKYLKISDTKERIIGFIILNIDDNKLYTPFIYAEPGYMDSIVVLICHHLIKYKAEMYLTYYPEVISEMKKNRFPIFIKRKYIRKSYLSSIFKDKISSGFFIHDGDGA